MGGEAAMLAIAYSFVYLFCGVCMVICLLPQMKCTVRVWLGLCLGTALEMWLPALCAFFFRFTLTAHLWALLPLLGLLLLSYFGRSRVSPRPFSAQERGEVRLLLFIALPLTLVGAYLQCTHQLSPAADGSLHVGQSTYGDLPLHLSIVTSLRNAAFPADYAIYPGHLLSYPFLADSLSTSFMLLGCSLRAALLLPGIFMTALVFSGYVLLAARMAETKKAAALAALFFFVNGGLGFLYLVDMQGTVLGSQGQNELQSVAGLMQRVRLVLNGWYQTPANHAEFTTYNLRWSNVIVDMMVPQRTTLAGWSQVLPCLYLLYDALRPQDGRPAGIYLGKGQDGPTAVYVKKEIDLRQAALLGVWAGMLPMVNTHCFLALGLVSLGWMAWDLIRNRRQWQKAVLFWLVYGALAVAAAAPQLFTWTFRQAAGSESFLRFQFNWVNGELGMQDGYFWFYIKNIGLPFVLIVLSLLEKNEKRRFIASGAFVVWAAAETVVFQPNAYDNNKLFYIWYMLCAVLAADYGLELLGRLRGLRAKNVIAALCAVVCFATGSLAILREIGSDYQMFSAEEKEAAAYVEKNTPPDAVFLTGTQHINFVSSLAGRTIVCGPDLWLYYHGFDTAERQRDIRAFYADPGGSAAVLSRYGVDYIVVGGSERYDYAVDEYGLMERFEMVYESKYGNIQIYRVPEG